MSHVRTAWRRPRTATLLLALSLPASAVPAVTPDGGATPLTTELLASGLDDPVAIAAPPGDARIFIAERVTGLIKVIDDGVLLPTPFLDLGASIEASFAEQGLLGLAFHPDFAANGYFFVCYTAPPFPGTSVIARYQVSAGNPNVANPNTRRVFLQITQPFQGHNVGCLKFGIDGNLYIGTGDGGFDDPFCLALHNGSLLGRILRIDVNRPGLDPPYPGHGHGDGFAELPGSARIEVVDGVRPYKIPANNPYVGVPGAAEETWHRGLRNPWRFCIDSLTGDMYIGDVGRDTIEEIDFAPHGLGGLNFGWKFMEGSLCFDDGNLDDCPSGLPACGSPLYRAPIHEFTHFNEEGFQGCAIIGGEVYRACDIPDLNGTYFFGDFCTGRIWSFRYDGSTLTDFMERTLELEPPGAPTINNVLTFGLDGFGNILLSDGNGGEIYRITSAASSAPSLDCNGNGVSDVCDIAESPDLDRNNNGLIDACERWREATGRQPLGG